jgi:hypothetical protein
MVENGGGRYDAISGGAALVGPASAVSDLIVSPTVRLHSEVPVKKVNRVSFSGNEKITRVVFPATIEEIEGGAFEKNSRLNQIVFAPDSIVRIIGHGAFNLCGSLESVSIPPSVQHLGAWCFKDCAKLATVTLPFDGDLTIIDDSCFEGCDITGGLVIPPKVREVRDRAFRLNRRLTSITFGADSLLEWLASGSLSQTAIEAITIPPRCKNIGEWTFMSTATLRSVTFSRGAHHEILNFGCYILQGTAVEHLVIPRSVTAIKDFAFDGLRTLRSVTIPEDVHIDLIGPRAFAGTLVRDLRFGEALRSVEPSAFEDCEALERFRLPAESQMRRCKSSMFQGCKKLKVVELPGVEGFDANVFDGCAALRIARFTADGQSEGLRERVMALPDNLFGEGARVFVFYPPGTLKAFRDTLRNVPEDFE